MRTISLPNRTTEPAHDTSPVFLPAGGASGSIATPSRLSANSGDGVGESGSNFPNRLAGARGPIRLFQESISRNNPFVLGSTWANSLVRYVRQYAPNTVGFMDHGVPVQATPNWTTNTVPQADRPMSSIPFSFRRITQTFREEFDTRIQADYLDRDQIQQSQVPRRYLTDTMGNQQSPYVFRLTKWNPAQSYGQTTQVLGGK